MPMRASRTTVFSFLILAALCFSLPAAAEDSKSLTKAEVEKIVSDYIMDNPQKILDSVDSYQKKSAAGRQTDSVAKNKQNLLNDIDSPETGNPDGDVAVVEFFDYNCGYCKKTFSSVSSVLEKDKNIRFIFKELPILSQSSETAAKWALAANKQKKYFEFHKALMNSKGAVDDALLEKTAKDIGLNIEQLKKDADGAEVSAALEKTRALAASLGIGGTPAFVIGDEIVPGMIFPEEMIKKITALRDKKKKK